MSTVSVRFSLSWQNIELTSGMKYILKGLRAHLSLTSCLAVPLISLVLGPRSTVFWSLFVPILHSPFPLLRFSLHVNAKGLLIRLSFCHSSHFALSSLPFCCPLLLLLCCCSSYCFCIYYYLTYFYHPDNLVSAPTICAFSRANNFKVSKLCIFSFPIFTSNIFN